MIHIYYGIGHLNHHLLDTLSSTFYMLFLMAFFSTVSISQDNVTIFSESADDVGTHFDLVDKQRKSGLGSF